MDGQPINLEHERVKASNAKAEQHYVNTLAAASDCIGTFGRIIVELTNRLREIEQASAANTQLYAQNLASEAIMYSEIETTKSVTPCAAIIQRELA